MGRLSSARTFEKFRVVRTVIGKLLKTVRMKAEVTFQQLMSTVKIGLRTIQKVSRISTATNMLSIVKTVMGFSPLRIRAER